MGGGDNYVTLTLGNAQRLWVPRPLVEQQHMRMFVSGPVRSLKEKNGDTFARVIATDWTLDPVCESCGAPQ